MKFPSKNHHRNPIKILSSPPPFREPGEESLSREVEDKAAVVRRSWGDFYGISMGFPWKIQWHDIDNIFDLDWWLIVFFMGIWWFSLWLSKKFGMISQPGISWWFSWWLSKKFGMIGQPGIFMGITIWSHSLLWPMAATGWMTHWVQYYQRDPKKTHWRWVVGGGKNKNIRKFCQLRLLVYPT